MCTRVCVCTPRPCVHAYFYIFLDKTTQRHAQKCTPSQTSTLCFCINRKCRLDVKSYVVSSQYYITISYCFTMGVGVSFILETFIHVCASSQLPPHILVKRNAPILSKYEFLSCLPKLPLCYTPVSLLHIHVPPSLSSTKGKSASYKYPIGEPKGYSNKS